MGFGTALNIHTGKFDLVQSTSVLDDRYVNVTGDTMTGALLGHITVDTKANILALSPAGNQLAYATDTTEFYLYDGSNWKVAPLELQTEAQAPDMGAYEAGGLGISDKAGYYSDVITDKDLSSVKLKEYYRTAGEGAVRTTTDGEFQVYLNGVWNDVVINFRLREDSDGNYEFEHNPVGFDLWYEIMSGNSDILGIDGKPIIQQYTTSMGAYQRDIIINGGTF